MVREVRVLLFPVRGRRSAQRLRTMYFRSDRTFAQLQTTGSYAASISGSSRISGFRLIASLRQAAAVVIMRSWEECGVEDDPRAAILVMLVTN
ncbi:hypothetical protein [Aetokthonos hydrillicola]|uniref:hypothetical protein n=2 Tax=Aetokthonos hydrillicola TaxID=1550245 RepID=UPI003BB7FE38